VTLLFFDGFETYDSAATIADGLGDVYDLHDLANGTDVTIAASDRITSGQAMRVNIVNTGDASGFSALGPQLHLAGLSSQDDWVFGVALKAASGLGDSSHVRPVFELLDSDAMRIISLRVNGDGDLTVDRINATNQVTTLDTAAGAISGAGWNYIEFKIKISDSVGTWDVRVNESSVMSGGPANTDQTGAGRPSHVRFGHVRSTDLDYDDLYILDDQGAVNNDFLGDVRVQRLKPNGAGDSSDLTRNTGSTNWEAVDEDGEDGDTSYVESATATERDLYNYEPLAGLVGSVFGVIAKPVLKKSDAGSRTAKLLCSSGGSEDESGTIYPAGSYVRQAKIFETDPNTSGLWLVDAVNSAQFGIEIVS